MLDVNIILLAVGVFVGGAITKPIVEMEIITIVHHVSKTKTRRMIIRAADKAFVMIVTATNGNNYDIFCMKKLSRCDVGLAKASFQFVPVITIFRQWCVEVEIINLFLWWLLFPKCSVDGDILRHKHYIVGVWIDSSNVHYVKTK